MISIIIPACNEEQYLEETINSIKYTNNDPHEIIVVCDGCTDKTEQIARKFTNKIVVLKERKGPAIAKDEGAKLAKYEKLIFLDADTKFTDGTLKEISKALKDKKVYGTCKIKPSNNKIKHKIMMNIKNLWPFPFTNGIIFCHKDLYEKVGGFGSVKKGEDGRFVRRLNNGNKFVILDKPVISSTRRFDKKGYIKVMLYWIKEYIKPTNKDYEVIR